MIQLEQYRVFAEVAAQKSFSRAAENLYISQPAVSRTIRLLEEALETKLFTRQARGVTLTQAGEALYGYVGQALHLLSGGEQYLEKLKGLTHGTLTVGASDTICQHYLLPYLEDFHRDHPGVSLKVTNRTSRETLALLRQGRADIGVVHLPTELGEHLKAEPLATVHDCFVVRPGLVDGKTPLTPEQISRLPLLMLEQESSTRRHLDTQFRAWGVTLTPQIELGSHDLLLSFALAGLGVATVVREYAAKPLAEGTLVELPLTRALPPREVAIVYRAQIPLTFAAREFLDRLKNKQFPPNL